MKSIFTASLLALAATATGQITLDQAAYSGWQPRNANAERLLPGTPYPMLTPATNALWNLTGVAYDPANSRLYVEGPFSGTDFPNATFYDSLSYPIAGAMRYGVQEAGALTATGFQVYGQRVPRQGYPLATMTGGPNDSLVFPAQSNAFSAPAIPLRFPATMSSRWSSDYSFTTDFTLTVAGAGLSNAPCQRKTLISRSDSVTGWGRMAVKDASGMPTTQMNVLMVKTIRYQTDSFFLNGAPAPPMLLSAFGLTQGQRTDRFMYNFYRSGELMPLLIASYLDNTFSNTQVDYMDVHVDRLTPAGVRTVSAGNGILAYPNPVRNHTVQLQLDGQNGASFEYVLVHVNGQVAGKGVLLVQNGAASLTADALSTPGIYYLQLYSAQNLIATLPLSVE